jgi:Ca2+-dependent lipid-binding protein
MKQSILSVHVVDARDLRPVFYDAVNAQVRLSIKDTRIYTKEIVFSNNPVWNEVLTFDITDAKDKLKVEVLDV